MDRFRWIIIPVALGLCLPSLGCGLFRRNRTTNNISSSVQINQQGRDTATLERHEYDFIDTSIGMNKSTGVFLLTIPVGAQTTHSEQVDSAYFAAVDRIPECDAIPMTRVDTRRIIIPLLLVNIVVKKVTVKGRCVHLKDDAELSGQRDDDAASDTGGGGDEPPLDDAEPATPVEG
ncbi:MAG: hypothetical protein AB1Z98_36320 [Nannocystaceae bacterium]